VAVAVAVGSSVEGWKGVSVVVKTTGVESSAVCVVWVVISLTVGILQLCMKRSSSTIIKMNQGDW